MMKAFSLLEAFVVFRSYLFAEKILLLINLIKNE